MASEPLLLKNVGIADSWTIDSYLKSGGYEGLKRVLKEFEPESSSDSLTVSAPPSGANDELPALW